MTALLSIDGSAGLPVRFRAVLAMAGLAGLAYLLLGPLSTGPAHVVLKGSGVLLLACSALQLRCAGAGWLATIMLLGAAGDMLLAMPGLFLAGAGCFALGHAVAIAFYLRHRRRLAIGDLIMLAALMAFGLAMPPLLTPPGQSFTATLVYGLLLCAMASSLWLSRFPRLAAIGALLFIASDTLLVLRLGGGGLIDPVVDGALVWSLYFSGQWLITLGVARGLLAKAHHGG
ncbi:MAG: lysoplasmalogenase [Alphaproteobacteria bacterium]|nr:lysoplasmalogenase [Alphaproteobacteria bacterium]